MDVNDNDDRLGSISLRTFAASLHVVFVRLGCPTINEAITLLLDQKQRQEDLAPIIDGAVHPVDLQAVIGVIDFDPFVAATAFEEVARHFLADTFLVIDADLGLSEAGGVVDAVCAFQGVHFLCYLLLVSEANTLHDAFAEDL